MKLQKLTERKCRRCGERKVVVRLVYNGPGENDATEWYLCRVCGDSHETLIGEYTPEDWLREVGVRVGGYDGPTTLICRCGYEPSSKRDLDEHVVAMLGDPDDHGETDR